MPDLFAHLGAAPLTVSAVNQHARLLLERNFASVAVVGEVSNLKSVSGHRYFTLKDPESQLAAVLFRREAAALRFALEDGLRIVATGRLTIYPPYGRYQMVVDRIEPHGAGALQLAFEQLKARLDAEGLFATDRKRQLPLVPQRVAVITSPTGAVIRDIVQVATRRFPRAHLILVPARVQGAASAGSIAAALGLVARSAKRLGIDVAIVARGGGSLEDLWGFNDETVARAIVSMPVPIVSAVGHETDYTIADFVADQRAPTPSAAAELVFPLHSELVARLSRPLDRARRGLRRELQSLRHRLQGTRTRLGDGRNLTRDAQQRIGHVHLRLGETMRRRTLQHRLRLAGVAGRLEALHPRARVAQYGERMRTAKDRMIRAMRSRVSEGQRTLMAADQHLAALSPLAVLERGYAIVLDDSGQALRRAVDTAIGNSVHVRLARGALSAAVTAIDDIDDNGRPAT